MDDLVSELILNTTNLILCFVRQCFLWNMFNLSNGCGLVHDHLALISPLPFCSKLL
jgi:hypothetical protein